jgi:HEAT repeat protein
MAELAVRDRSPEVRSAAAAALGEMGSRSSISKLRGLTGDKDPSVALAAAHALVELKDDSGYDVYYEILTGERKAGKGAFAQAAAFKDPKKLAELGFQEGIGLIPFAGLGWRAFKLIRKDDTSPVRAGAATVLARDPDPRSTEALANAAGDKSWIIRAAALEALARRGDPSVLNTVELYLADEEGEVKYAAAATALRLLAIKQARGVATDKQLKKN